MNSYTSADSYSPYCDNYKEPRSYHLKIYKDDTERKNTFSTKGYLEKLKKLANINIIYQQRCLKYLQYI